jgi:hypothetical protein
MENILPFLIGMAALAFKIYTNFRKEQEKARDRNPSAPVSKPDRPNPAPVQSVQKHDFKHAPVLVEEAYDPAHPYEPQYKTHYKEPVIVKTPFEPRYERVRPESVNKEKVNPEFASGEVLRNRSIHLPHQHKIQIYREADVEHPYADFDFRDAVIKEAILNRPQF